MAAKAAADPQTFISEVRLIGRRTQAFRSLRGFDKSRHTVPDAVSSATSGFLARLAAPELGEEAESVFQQVRRGLAYKRAELSLDVTSPSAVLTARDFTLELAYALDEADPGTCLITRTLTGLTRPELVEHPEFDRIFAGAFETIAFGLAKGVRVEAVIDAVEALDGVGGLEVSYPSDCRDCTLTVPGVEAAVVCDGASLELRFSRAGSPRELIAGFAAVRSAFHLSRASVLGGLVGAKPRT